MRESAEGRGAICIYAPYAYPLFTQGRVEFTGGAEVQQVTIARGLAARGFALHMVTCDYGQPARVTVDGITVHRAFPPAAGLPVVRFFHPRLTRTLAALAAADAEVYYVRGSGLPAGVTCDLARARGAAFVLGAASDLDARPDLSHLGSARDRWWYRRALRGARAVVAQTETQRRMFQDAFGISSVVIPNLVQVAGRPGDSGGEGPVVWLGTYKPMKRPEWFTELARRMPERRFVMCGVIPIPPDTHDAWVAARDCAERCPNLEVRGYLEHDRIGELLSGAALFVHTSPTEGFSNTMLEAWAHGVPSVSAVDPDGIVVREGLGEVVDSLAGMESAVHRMLADPAGRAAAGARARSHVQRHHAPDVVIDRLAELLDRVVADVRSRRRGGRAVEAGRGS